MTQQPGITPFRIIFLLLMLPALAQAAVEPANILGLTQIMLEGGPGSASSTEGGGAKVGVERARIGFRWKKDDLVSAFFQAEFQKADSTRVISEAEIILDAFIEYHLAEAFNLRVGSFVMPSTMDFQTSIKRIDITKRGIDSFLALNRSIGAMTYGHVGGGLHYAIAAAEAADRSRAVAGGQPGDDYAYAARLFYDLGPWHFEGSYGISENASGAGGEDYNVADVGFKYNLTKWFFKGEYTIGTNIAGVDGTDQSVWWLQAGYRLNEKNEVLVRHYQTDSSVTGAEDLTLGNTYFGYNHIFNDNALIRVNYVLVTGDKDEWEAGGRGVGGHFADDIFLTMAQFYF